MSPDPDDLLLDELAALLAPQHEPPPDVLHAARETFTWRMVDAEIAALVYDSLLDDDRTGVRSADQPRTMTFESGDVSVELEVDRTSGARRLIGQVVPAQAVDLELHVVDPGAAEEPTTSVATRADEWGRFTLPLPDARSRIALGLRWADGAAVRSTTIVV